MNLGKERYLEYRRYAVTAALLAVLNQVAFTLEAHGITNPQRNYGAPFIVGEGGVGFEAGMYTFSFGIWLINVAITFPVFLILVGLLNVRRVSGAITVFLVVIASTVPFVQFDIFNGTPDQVFFWMCGIVASAIFFGIERIVGLLICRMKS